MPRNDSPSSSDEDISNEEKKMKPLLNDDNNSDSENDSNSASSSKAGFMNRLKNNSKNKNKNKSSNNESDTSDNDKKPGLMNRLKNKKKGKGKEKSNNNDDDDDDDGDDPEKGNTKRKKKSSSKHTKNTHTKSNQLTLMEDTNARFIPSDKDIKGDALHISEAPGFVRIDFGDGTGPLSLAEVNNTLRDVEDEKAPGKMRQRQVYVYVESASTGRFFKYATDTAEVVAAQKQKSKASMLMQSNAGVNNDDFEASREAAMERLERLLYSGFLVLQGLLAGSVTATLAFAVSGTTKQFLLEYGVFANETRRLYYIMTTISFVGAMNDFSRVHHNAEEWRRRSTSEKMELIFLVVCYFGSLFFTLLAGVDDIQFHYMTNIDTSFTEEELRSLDDNVAQWKMWTVARFISCVIGWLVVCQVQHRNSQRAANAVRESHNLSEALQVAHRRIAQLTGAKLDKMGREDLLELVSQQRSGLEQTEHVLENLPRHNKDVFAPETPKTVVSPRKGGAGGTMNPMFGTPSRPRLISSLPASISSKAPPPLNLGGLDGESPV